MAITIAGCDRILRTAKEQGTTLYVGHNMRHFAVILKMKELIDDGVDVIGDRIQTWSYERRIGVVAREQQEPVLQLTERTEFYAISDTRINALTQETPAQQSPKQIMHTEEKAENHVQLLHTVTEDEADQVQNTHMDQNPENTHVQKMHTDKKTEIDPLQKLHTDTCSSNSNNINTTTTSSNTSRAREELHFPSCISANERKIAMMYLNPIEDIQQQDVLDEWHGRLSAANRRSTPIENPIGYLASLCRRVKTGEFQITIGIRIRDTRDREKRRKESEKRREEEEQRRLKEMVKSTQANPGSTGTNKIQQRMDQILKERKKRHKENENQTSE